MKLKIGQKAPEFEKLGKFSTDYLLLYFYPKDNTPGCTTEACNFRDNFEKFKDKLEVIGVSADSEKSHENFKKSHNLPFKLIADPEKRLINAYGTDGLLFPKRTSFLIDKTGKIVKIYEKVKPEKHVEEILKDLETI